MAFLAPLAAAAGRGLLMRAGASMLGRTAASSAEGAAGGGAGSALAKVTKSPLMPIPSMGSNGGMNPVPSGVPNSPLNADQFR